MSLYRRFTGELVAVVSMSVSVAMTVALVVVVIPVAVLIVTVGVAASVIAWTITPLARAPTALVVAPARAFMFPVCRTPCCSVVRRLIPAAGIPNVVSADGGPVTRYPFVADF